MTIAAKSMSNRLAPALLLISTALAACTWYVQPGPVVTWTAVLLLLGAMAVALLIVARRPGTEKREGPAFQLPLSGASNMLARLMGLKTISPGDLHRMAQSSEPVSVIDVNSHQSWMTAHVPGAHNLHPADYTDSDLPSDKDAALVFYCSNPMCRKAPTAARRAKNMGYSNVRVMSAGINGWLAAQLPIESGA